jgi:hypothetical protein
LEITAVDNLKRRGSELNLPRLREHGIRFAHADIRNPEDLRLDEIRPELIVECSAEPSGLATKRWLALSAVVPPSYEAASIGPFLNVDAVPADIRAPYRPIAQDILTTGETGLDRILGSHRLPTTFKLGISSIPISWYVGLKESDELGVKVFFASVLHHPREYLASIARASARVWSPPDGRFPKSSGAPVVGSGSAGPPPRSRRARICRQSARVSPGGWRQNLRSATRVDRDAWLVLGARARRQLERGRAQTT